MRLPPLPPDALDADQRAFHDRSVALIERKYGCFETRDARGALIGPWSVWIRHPAIGGAQQALVAAIAKLDSLPPRTHEIVILALGARFNAAYELYAHCAVATRAGLDDDQIAALCAGRIPDRLSVEETIAYDCATALARGGVLPDMLYDTALKRLGPDAFAQMTYLAGTYAFVSILLNAYDVPAPRPEA